MGFWQTVQQYFLVNGEYMLRILLAALMGGLIGLERSRRQKEAGVRTHVIVALGSALIMVVSKFGFVDVVLQYGVNCDPSRLASNIVTGVSFLGAGVIFVKNVSIRGLTTAAGIWATAGVGLTIGAGMYGVGIFAGILILLFQVVLHKYLNGLEGTSINELDIVLRYSPEAMKHLRDQLAAHGMGIEYYKIKKSEKDVMTCKLALRMPRDTGHDELLFLLDDNEDVLEIDM